MKFGYIIEQTKTEVLVVDLHRLRYREWPQAAQEQARKLMQIESARRTVFSDLFPVHRLAAMVIAANNLCRDTSVESLLEE